MARQVIRNVSIFDGSGALKRPGAIAAAGERIVTAADEIAEHPGDEVVDGAGATPTAARHEGQ